MKRLTPTEEKIMLAIWSFKKCMSKEIIDQIKDKTVSINTLSTMVRILEKKKFIKHRSVNRKYIYYPKITKESYREFLTRDLLENYFDDKDSFIDLLQQEILIETL